MGPNSPKLQPLNYIEENKKQQKQFDEEEKDFCCCCPEEMEKEKRQQREKEEEGEEAGNFETGNFDGEFPQQQNYQIQNGRRVDGMSGDDEPKTRNNGTQKSGCGGGTSLHHKVEIVNNNFFSPQSNKENDSPAGDGQNYSESIGFNKKGEEGTQRRLYKADESPPLPLTFLFGLQQVMVSVSVLVSIPILISDLVCPGRDRDQLRVRLIAGTFVVCGISTILQSAFGLRLALLQGVAFAYIPSVRAFMSLPEYKCSATADDFVPEEVYENKMTIIQGTLMASSCITMLIGATGLVGKMTKFIGPMTVSPLLMLMMLSSVKITVERIEQHWISLVMAGSLFATVLYLSRLKVPFPGYGKGCKFKWVRFNVFGQFPYLTAILFSWALCFVLTLFDLIPRESVARTDRPSTQQAIANAPYARFPFPGQFGAPSFNIGLFVGFLVSAQTTLFEAVGNYHAVARVSEERPPPSHALNRGIMAEGLGCFISGLIGPGVGITTHAENVGVISITRVASRVTMIFGGCTLIAFGIVTKLGAILSAIPDPLVGVVLATSMAMVGGVAIANVQTVDLRLTRNVAILGFSIMMGTIVPEYYERNPNVVATGYRTLDQVIQVLLSLPMFVGAATACFLDNTVGGATRKQRGLRERGVACCEGNETARDVYLYPAPLQRLIDSAPFVVRFLPFAPKRKQQQQQSKDEKKKRRIDERGEQKQFVSSVNVPGNANNV